MRLKKKNIMEMVNNQPTNSTNNQQAKLPTQQEFDTASKNLENFKKEVGEVSDEIKDMPFISKMDENIGDFDPNYGASDDLEYLASRRQELIDAYAEWLNTPEGIEYIKNADSGNQGINSPEEPLLPFNESVKQKKKVIKTIKVKDLK